MEHGATTQVDILTPDVMMVILTWVTFLLLLFILKKFAWKPILEGLKLREEHIRQSLEDADKAKEQLAQIEMTRVRILDEAKVQAVGIINDARRAAGDVAKQVEAKARLSAQETINNAQAQIEGQRQQVRELLRKESVEIAISLAGKILKENTDTDKNRALVDAAIKEI